MAEKRYFGSVHREPRRVKDPSTGKFVTVPGEYRPGFYIRFRWEGRRFKKYGGPSKRIANERLSQIHGMLSKGIAADEAIRIVYNETTTTNITFRQAVDEYLVDSAGRKKSSTLDVDRLRFNTMLREAPWSRKPLADISKQDLNRWISDRERRGRAASTINRERDLISGLFSWAVSLEYVDSNPARKVKRRSERGREKTIWLTAAEATALIESASPEFRPFLLMALHTAMRRAELLLVCWDDVDFDRRRIVIRAANAKSSRNREIPMSGTLMATLSALKGERNRRVGAPDRVFVLEDGTPYSIAIVRRRFNAALVKCAAIPKEKRDHVTLHTCRHTWASLTLQGGEPVFNVSKILGHASISFTVARYGHFCVESGRTSVDGFDQLMSKAAAGGEKVVGA